MGSYYPGSKVELRGAIAKYYDILLDTVTFGRYSHFIQKVISLLDIKREDKIIDLGAGTGRNACLMAKHISSKGELIGFEISEDMLANFNKNCSKFSNVKAIKKRIEKDLGYKAYFDKAFISFVLHGFPQEVRLKIIKNIFKALKNNGELFILDYNEFLLENMPIYARIPFKTIECTYAFDFIEKDWKKILAGEGFKNFSQHLFLKNYVRLLRAIKIT
ncbi:MAG: class I SAM-dependent methyltransferase [Candidatus Humimicrobiaceae bacterium]